MPATYRRSTAIAKKSNKITLLKVNFERYQSIHACCQTTACCPISRETIIRFLLNKYINSIYSDETKRN